MATAITPTKGKSYSQAASPVGTSPSHQDKEGFTIVTQKKRSLSESPRAQDSPDRIQTPKRPKHGLSRGRPKHRGPRPSSTARGSKSAGPSNTVGPAPITGSTSAATPAHQGSSTGAIPAGHQGRPQKESFLFSITPLDPNPNSLLPRDAQGATILCAINRHINLLHPTNKQSKEIASKLVLNKDKIIPDNPNINSPDDIMLSNFSSQVPAPGSTDPEDYRLGPVNCRVRYQPGQPGPKIQRLGSLLLKGPMIIKAIVEGQLCHWQVTQTPTWTWGVIKGLPKDLPKHDYGLLISSAQEQNEGLIVMLPMGRNGTFKVKFRGDTLPPLVFTRYGAKGVERFFGAHRCTKCLKEGHARQNCRAALPTCSRCGDLGHHKTDCSPSRPEKCSLCLGPHSTFDSTCPKNVEARAKKLKHLTEMRKRARSEHRGEKPAPAQADQPAPSKSEIIDFTNHPQYIMLTKKLEEQEKTLKKQGDSIIKLISSVKSQETLLKEFKQQSEEVSNKLKNLNSSDFCNKLKELETKLERISTKTEETGEEVRKTGGTLDLLVNKTVEFQTSIASLQKSEKLLEDRHCENTMKHQFRLENLEARLKALDSLLQS